MNTLCYIRKDSINKNLVVSCFLTDFLKAICLHVDVLNFSKLDKDLFLKSVSLFELLGNQKLFATSKRTILNNRTKDNIFNLYLKVVLRKKIMLNFLKYINCFLLSEIRNTYSYSNYNGSFYFYKFKVKNIMIVRILKSNFLMWFLPVCVTFEFSSNLLVPLIYTNFNK
jgi:hypothetical protein